MRLALSMMILAVWPSLHAATLESLTIEQMAQEATAVARGRVGEARSARFGALVYTLYPFAVIDQWTGAALESVEVAVPGGFYEGVTYRFGGAPELQAGGEYVLFLWKGPSGRTQIVGLSQGVFRVVQRGDALVASRSAASDSVFVGGDAGENAQTLEMPLGDLAARVRSAVGGTSDR